MSAWEMLTIAGLGALGALLRFGLMTWMGSGRAATATVVVNTIGSFGAGVGISAGWGVWGALLAAGLWGSLTTLSTLAVDVVERSVTKGWAPAAGLLVLHVVGGLLGIFLGISVGHLLSGG